MRAGDSHPPACCMDRENEYDQSRPRFPAQGSMGSHEKKPSENRLSSARETTSRAVVEHCSHEMKRPAMTIRLLQIVAIGLLFAGLSKVPGWGADERTVTLYLRGSGEVPCEVVEVQTDKLRARHSKTGLSSNLSDLAITYSRAQIERAESEFASNLIREASQLLSSLKRARCEALKAILDGLVSRQSKLEETAKNLQWLIPEAPEAAKAIGAVVPHIREAISIYNDIHRETRQWQRMAEGIEPLSTGWETEIQSSLAKAETVKFAGSRKQLVDRLQGLQAALELEQARRTEPFFVELREAAQIEKGKVVAIRSSNPVSLERLEQLANGIANPDLKEEADPLLAQLREVIKEEEERQRIQEEYRRIASDLDKVRAGLARTNNPAAASDLIARLEKTAGVLASLPDSASRGVYSRQIKKIREKVDARLAFLEESNAKEAGGAKNDRGFLTGLANRDIRWAVGVGTAAVFLVFLLLRAFRPGKRVHKTAEGKGIASSSEIVPPEATAATADEEEEPKTESVPEVQTLAAEDTADSALDLLMETDAPPYEPPIPEPNPPDQDQPIEEGFPNLDLPSTRDEIPSVPTFAVGTDTSENLVTPEELDYGSQFDYLPSLDQVGGESLSLEGTQDADSIETGDSEPEETTEPPLLSEEAESLVEDNLESVEEETTTEPASPPPSVGDTDLMDILGLGGVPPVPKTPPLEVIELGQSHKSKEGFEKETTKSDELDAAWTPVGINSRKYFDSRLSEIAEESQRNQDTVALLIVSLDGVSYLSEEEWQEVRPSVLQTVSATLRSITRTSDLLACYEDGKFAVAIYPTITTRALPMGLRIRETIRKALQEDLQGSPIKTVSVGLCCLDGRSDEVTSAELIRCAEQALRAATRKGGNQVVLYGYETE